LEFFLFNCCVLLRGLLEIPNGGCEFGKGMLYFIVLLSLHFWQLCAFVYFVSLICDCMSDGCACCIIVMHGCFTASQSEACSSDDSDFRVAFVV